MTWEHVERDVETLAARLAGSAGRDALREARFVAIPRGGHIVLGLLAYALGLERGQLRSEPGDRRPLVVVDDCALTGHRLGKFLESDPADGVVFAHLYSHPALRAAVLRREPRVVLCVAAEDLSCPDGKETQGLEAPEWLAKPRYWAGPTEVLAFPWGEPDRPIRNPLSGQVEPGWRLVPPELCAAHRPGAAASPVIVQTQQPGPGPCRLAPNAVAGEIDGLVVVGNLLTGRCTALEGVAAEMWRAVVTLGDPEAAAVALAQSYSASHLQDSGRPRRTDERAAVRRAATVRA